MIACLFGLRGRLALVGVEWIEALENETAVVAKQLVQAEHPQEENRIVVIPLNPLALAPRALHAVHSSRVRVQIGFTENCGNAGFLWGQR